MGLSWGPTAVVCGHCTAVTTSPSGFRKLEPRHAFPSQIDPHTIWTHLKVGLHEQRQPVKTEFTGAFIAVFIPSPCAAGKWLT